QAGAEADHRADAPDSRSRESLAELERAKASPSGPAQEQGDRESDLRAQLHAANAAAERAQAALKEEGARKKALEERLRILCNSLKLEQVERRKRFDEEVAGLRQVRDELQSKLVAEQQTAGERTRRADVLEGHLRDSAAEVERVKAEFAKQAAEQRGIESEWREK